MSNATYLSISYLTRVCKAYRLAVAGDTNPHGSIWSPIDRKRKTIHKALIYGDLMSLREIFANPVATDLFLGADYACHSILDFKHDRLAGEPVTSTTIEHLETIAYAKGKLLEPLGEHELYPRLTNEPVPSYRAILAIYQSRHICVMKPASVLEIGPGLGRVAYYCHRAGINYTTIDLPLGIVAQACWLGLALGPDSIWFQGEDPAKAEGRIKLLTVLPAFQDYDLVFNSDSITEMPFNVAVNYMKWIHQHCNRFYSINHSKNPFTATHIARKWFLPMHRRPYPMQDGYLEEVFKPRAVPASTMPWTLLAEHALRHTFGRLALPRL